ncbi:MAG: 50S ribosomal protein L2 [Proteobacteria bacterium]|nr:50S ribosomal protein L2 [Pseudomonadota bacterium]
MALKRFNPITPGLRGRVIVDRSELWKGAPERTLIAGQAKTGGRNNLGRTTSFRTGGGHKQKYRMVDFLRRHDGVEAVVQRIEYDPNRTAFIALVKYNDGKLSYVLAPQKIAMGDVIISGENVDIKVGNTLPMRNVPVGTLLHNIELRPGKGGQLAKAAGSYVQLVGKDGDQVLIRLRSGEVRFINADCRGTVGVVSNLDHQNVKLGKAGASRHRGVRPVVRGVAMNPVDHPHGGGEGKTSGGRHPVTPWGKPTKGKRTRNNKSTDKYIVKRRYK